MKVIVVGANGQVGEDISKQFMASGNEVVRMTHADIEVFDRESVKRALDTDFDVLVNASGLHTRACEQDIVRAFMVNAMGPKYLAEEAAKKNSLIVHISTDQVFDGKQGFSYRETDAVNPLTVYGNTKLSGEYFVLNSGAKCQILRTTALFGHSATRGKPGGLNFVELMLNLAKERGIVSVVGGEYTTPTSTKSLALQVEVLSKLEEYGLFHACGTGSCSWYSFAKEIFLQAHQPVNLKMAEPNESGFVRGKCLVLSNFRLHTLGLNIFKPWQEELRGYLECRNLDS